ncbi:hypothetical protein RS130_11595 [Paraglaciecola aquimarina]|uniref:Uncharacterized protein n=1 Tax=Paraglaciecola aquimarina TaxID=1235557 RepID=A0ABU3SWV3_9ALTE|nr:hypothetical protein [Paraglaciecola aquimarina]MDU0354493.1 hypothetical protein [Paraglaciecola aquimarina]
MLKFLYGTNHSNTTSFHYIDWNKLVTNVETPPNLGTISPKEAKEQSAFIAATDAPNKTKDTIMSHNNFTLLRLDIDETELNLDTIADTLESLFIESFLIHTTASHQQNENGNRYRVYIELAVSIPYGVWAALESYLSYIFKADDCATRPQQIMYLPVKLDGDKYAYKVAVGKALTVEGSQLLEDAKAFEQAQLEEQEAANTKPIKPTYKPDLIGQQVSIIDLVNEAYTWDDLLLSYGYKTQGKAYLPPESTSAKAGAYILTSNTDGKERYYSHHESDPCATGQSLDKFDFICIRGFRGNTSEALKQIAARYFPDVDRHNKEEWKIHQYNQKAQKLFKAVS